MDSKHTRATDTDERPPMFRVSCDSCKFTVTLDSKAAAETQSRIHQAWHRNHPDIEVI